MKIYIVTYYSIIDGIKRRKFFDKAYRTKEAAQAAMNDVYKYWMSETEKHINSGHIVKQHEDDCFVIYNLFKPERFTVDCSIVEFELPDEDNI